MLWSVFPQTASAQWGFHVVFHLTSKMLLSLLSTDRDLLRQTLVCFPQLEIHIYPHTSSFHIYNFPHSSNFPP